MYKRTWCRRQISSSRNSVRAKGIYSTFGNRGVWAIHSWNHWSCSKGWEAGTTFKWSRRLNNYPALSSKIRGKSGPYKLIWCWMVWYMFASWSGWSPYFFAVLFWRTNGVVWFRKNRLDLCSICSILQWLKSKNDQVMLVSNWSRFDLSWGFFFTFTGYFVSEANADNSLIV